MCKDTKNISEISNFFKGKQQSTLLQAFSMLVERLNMGSSCPAVSRSPTANYDADLQRDLLRTVEYGLRDTMNGRLVDGQGTNQFQPGTPFRSQQALYNCYLKENETGENHGND